MSATSLDRIALPGRLLEPDELRETAEAIAKRPDLWRGLVVHDASRRQYTSLYVDRHIGVWVISWMPGHDTGWHDHAASHGAVAVALGEIREERPVLGGPPRRTDATPGESFCFDNTEIHRMADLSAGPAVTVHAYSPPLLHMGVYIVESDGYIRRRHVDWDEHLDATGHPVGRRPVA